MHQAIKEVGRVEKNHTLKCASRKTLKYNAVDYGFEFDTKKSMRQLCKSSLTGEPTKFDEIRKIIVDERSRTRERKKAKEAADPHYPRPSSVNNKNRSVARPPAYQQGTPPTTSTNANASDNNNNTSSLYVTKVSDTSTTESVCSKLRAAGFAGIYNESDVVNSGLLAVLGMNGNQSFEAEELDAHLVINIALKLPSEELKVLHTILTK